MDSELFELMYQLSRSVKERMAYFSEEANITMSQFMALSFIEKEGLVQMKDIAEHFGIEMPTATSLLNKLARHLLIKRSSDASDRRIVKVSLSKAGEGLLINAKKIQEENIKKMLSYLSEEQKINMKNILTTLQEKHIKHEK